MDHTIEAHQSIFVILILFIYKLWIKFEPIFDSTTPLISLFYKEKEILHIKYQYLNPQIGKFQFMLYNIFSLFLKINIFVSLNLTLKFFLLLLIKYFIINIDI